MTDVGELHATFVFETAEQAKAGWERATSQTRSLSVNRWSLDPDDLAQARAVTVLGEERVRHEFERACELLGQTGRQVTPPAFVIERLRLKRANARVGRRIVRAPAGRLMGARGEDLGPLKRPQG